MMMKLAMDLPPAPSASGSLMSGEEPLHILLVDDQPQNLLALEAILDGLGQNLVRAGSGSEALRHLLQRDFAVILMDVRMPGMDGLETASLIRKRPKCHHTPIIFITAYEDADRVFRGYELGAMDYLIKPIIPAILRSKVAVLLDLAQMNRKVKRQAQQLCEMERLRHERELTAIRERWEMERLREEALMARQIQERLFPMECAPMPGFDIGGGCLSAEATGGDYFDYIPMIDQSVGIVIGDVSGHGYGPALLMAEIRAYLRALLLTRADIGEVLGLLNRALHADVPEGRFATLFLGKLDGQNHTFTYLNAGHPTGYLLDATGRVKRRLGSTGVPLAILADELFCTADPIPLEGEDVIVLVTDGILEAAWDGGSPFGIDGVLNLVRAKRHESARAIVSALYDAVRHHCQGERQRDDMTALVIKVDPVPGVSNCGHTDSTAGDTWSDLGM